MTFFLSGLNPIGLFSALFLLATLFTLTGLFLVHKLVKEDRFDYWEGYRFIPSFFTIIGALLGLVLLWFW